MTDYDQPVTDSPVGWVAAHSRRYVESDGSRGHRWSGVHTLLLTTRGRRTGMLRRTPLIYGRDDDRYIVVASNAGRPTHPNWYLNLQQHPDVVIQVGATVTAGRAHTAEDADRTRLWGAMAAIWPDYERHQARTARIIPVVAIAPTGMPVTDKTPER